MSLEEYEAIQADKKAALNKAAKKKDIDMAAFEGMKTYVRKETEEVCGVGRSRRGVGGCTDEVRAA